MSKIDSEEVERLYWDEEMSQNEVANQLDTSRSKIRTVMKNAGIPRRSHKDLRNEPDLEWNRNLAYIVGVLKGDGHVRMSGGSGQINLNVTSDKLARSLKNSLEEIGLNPGIYREEDAFERGYTNVLYCYSTSFYEWFTELSFDKLRERILSRKSMTKSFLRGIYEGEGFLTHQGDIAKGYALGIVNTNKSLVSLLEGCLDSLKIDYSTYRQSRSENKDLYTLKITKFHQINNFLNQVDPCIKKDIGGGTGAGYDWTKEEIGILKEKYPRKGSNIEELIEQGRTRKGIRRKAQKMENLACKVSHEVSSSRKWTNGELKLLREKYPENGTDIERLIDRGRSKDAIAQKAHKMGVKYDG